MVYRMNEGYKVWEVTKRVLSNRGLGGKFEEMSINI